MKQAYVHSVDVQFVLALATVNNGQLRQGTMGLQANPMPPSVNSHVTQP